MQTHFSTRILIRTLPIAALLAILCLGSRAPQPVAAAAASVQGDINCSGQADPVDSLQLLLGQAGLQADAGCLADSGDVDCDGDADTTDMTLILRFAAGAPAPSPADCVAVGAYLETPPTSESLIADALTAGDITYEQSLLYRAYALYDHPDLPPQFRSPLPDMHAGTQLFLEVEQNRAQLSQALLDQLEPFSARPADPISIFNNPPNALTAAAPVVWKSKSAGNGAARVWLKDGPDVDAKLTTYADAATKVWNALPGIFRYGIPDTAGAANINPDGAIDIYFVDGGSVDPRMQGCDAVAPPADCAFSDNGLTRAAPPHNGDTWSAYVMISTTRQGDALINTLAHELGHVGQFTYDAYEPFWLMDATATWTAFRVVQKTNSKQTYTYDRLPAFFKGLDKPLTRDTADDLNRYGSWLFFLFASMEKGDSIVTKVWEKAAAHGEDGINAVNQVFPLDENFDDFSVRNWNKDPVVKQYKDATKPTDPIFPQNLHPKLGRDYTFLTEADDTLDLPVKNLSSVYYRYVFPATIRHIIIENNLQPIDGAHVWAIEKIAGDWQEPEDLSDSTAKVFCRDLKDTNSGELTQDLSEVIIIISNSKITGDLPTPVHNAPRVIADSFGCTGFSGTIHTTLHDTSSGDDITYDSGDVAIEFVARDVQDTPGDVIYDLASWSGPVDWVATGTSNGCTIEGHSTVGFPGHPYTGIEPDAGILVVIGPGDNHSMTIAAYDANAFVTKTCPGDPPTISHDGFSAAFLALITLEHNTNDGGVTVLEGDQFFTLGTSLTYHFDYHLDPTGPIGSPP